MKNQKAAKNSALKPVDAEFSNIIYKYQNDNKKRTENGV